MDNKQHDNDFLGFFSAKLKEDLDRAGRSTAIGQVARVVPTTATVSFRSLRRMHGTVLYTDLMGSSGLPNRFGLEDATRIIQAFHYVVCSAICGRGGQIRSFDGDRVMAVFSGSERCDNAVRVALELNAFFDERWKERMNSSLGRRRLELPAPRFVTGIDESEVQIAKVGLRDRSDLLWVGRAPNLAAKLSDLRKPDHKLWITSEVWRQTSNKMREHLVSCSWSSYSMAFSGADVQILATDDGWPIFGRLGRRPRGYPSR